MADTLQTVANIVAEVQLTFQSAESAVILDCINRVHKDLCSEWPIYKSTMYIPVVAGTQEYAIDSTVMGIRACTYIMDTTGSYRVLDSTEVGDLDREERAWRRYATGLPRSFYLDAGAVGLVPAPSSTTVGTPPYPSGAPYIELQITSYQDLGMQDTIPPVLRSSQVYTQGARRYYAEMAAPDKVPFWDMLFQKEMNDVERSLGRRNSNYRRKATPDNTGFSYQV